MNYTNGLISLLPTLARTATPVVPDQQNLGGAGVMLALDVTATPNNAETLTVGIQIPVITAGGTVKYVTITAFAALVASALGAAPTTETYLYTLFPGALETAAVAKHEVQGLYLPRNWRPQVVHSAGGSWTYTLSAFSLGIPA